MSAPRIVLFGIRCRFTDTVVQWLASGGLEIVALALPGPPGQRGVHRERVVAGVVPMAGVTSGRPSVPVVRLGRLDDPQVGAAVAALMPDVILVVCYPRRIPATVLRTASLAAVNLHPSLLPRHRGPDPIFWTYRHDDPTGVSLHDLVDDLDAGPVLAQQTIELDDGLAEPDIERELALAGAGLFAATLQDLIGGRVVSASQDETQATYESWPTPDDYTLDTRMTARGAFRFLRAFERRGERLAIRAGSRTISVSKALRFGSGVASSLGCDTIVSFEDGWVEVLEEGHRRERD